MRNISLFLLVFLFVVSANAQLSGTYTISANNADNPDYPSFSAAASALSAGVSGEVIFQVSPGSYEEFVTINSIAGTSSSNKVIFRGMGTDNQQVVITSNAGYTDNSTVKLNGANFVTFENLTITTTSENKAQLLRFTGSVNNSRFENVRFVGYDFNSSSTDNDKNLVHMNNVSGVYCNGNEFVGCQFINGGVALYLQGKDMSQFNTGVLVENCSFSNQQSKSIYILFFYDAIVRGNTIINANDYKTDYNAIDAYQCYNACVFENNVINVTRTTSYTTAVKLRPCVGNEENHIIFRNNIVNLNSNASSYSYCFRISHGSNTNLDSYIDCVHNTFKCSGSGSNGNIHVEKKVQKINFYNNLLVNESNEGYVLRFNVAISERYSDYNRVSYTCSNFGRNGSSDCATLADWTDSVSLDANSAICTPSFVSAQDLHLMSNDGINVANQLSYVTTDIDGETRSQTPCAGADEHFADTNQPPIVLNPISDITMENFPDSRNVDISNVFDDPDDENENIEVSLLSNSNPSLVSATLDENTISLTRLLSTGGAATITLQAISAEDTITTSFSVTCIAQDLPPVVANPLGSVVFTTFPQTLSFDLEGVFDDPDNNNLFMEYEAEADGDFVTAYVDYDDMLVIVRNTPNEFTDNVVVTATSNGKTVEMNVQVSGDEITIEIATADFEDVELSAQGYWTPAQEGEAQMLSRGWIFSNYYSSYFWGGFTASNRTDTTLDGLDAQYTAITGVGHNGSSNYAVAYTYGSRTEITAADGLNHTVTGCYVTNNLWAYNHMLYGEYGLVFGGSNGSDPDYFVLHATGKDSNGNTTGSLDFYLADYRSDNSDDDYILNTWEWFDLSSLGEVASISFSLESTIGNGGGMLTPAYFCMDDFNGIAPTPHEDQAPYIANPVADWTSNLFPDSTNIDLTGVATDDDSPDDAIVYSLLTNSNETAVSAQVENNMLTITRLNAEENTATLTLRATSGNLYVDFSVNVILVEPGTPHEDQAPYIANPVADWTSNLFPDSTNIDLTGVATDDDSPDDAIVYSLLTNSNETAVSAQVENNTLTITRLNAEENTLTLTIRAISGNLYVDFSVNVILNLVTSINDYETTMSIYPNPTSGQITIDLPQATEFEYSIINLMGQKVSQEYSSGEYLQLDLSDFAKGVYYIRIKIDDKLLNSKVTIK